MGVSITQVKKILGVFTVLDFYCENNFKKNIFTLLSTKKFTFVYVNMQIGKTDCVKIIEIL